MIKELDDCKTDSITVFLLGKKVPTIKLSCKANEVPNSQFFSYGIVNNQAVMSILTLWDDPKTNNDLPIVIKQILKLN